MESQLQWNIAGEVLVAWSEAYGPTTTSSNGFFQEGNFDVMVTRALELYQSKQCDSFNHEVYTVEMVYLVGTWWGYQNWILL